MPEREQPSPWSSGPQHDAYRPRAEPTSELPAHAWVSAGPYGTAAAQPAPAVLAAPPGPPYAPGPIEVRVAAAPSSGRGLAIVGVVLGGLALLGLGFVLVFVVFLGFMDDGSGGGGYAPLRGTIAPAAGSALKGSALAEEVTKKLEDDGAEPDDIVCPDTAEVGKDVTTVCHGTDFGDQAAFVVFFEDEKGSYTLLEV